MKLEKMRKFKIRTVLLFSFIVILVVALGIFLFNKVEQEMRNQKYQELKAIADLKEAQLRNWLKEMIKDIEFITNNKFFNLLLEEWLVLSNFESREKLRALVKNFSQKYGFESIVITRPECNILFSQPENIQSLNNIIIDNIKYCAKRGKIFYYGPYFCELEQKIYFDFTAPLLKNNQVFAVILLRIDPDGFLFPLIMSWPTRSETGETAILKVENDSVVFLNELRHQKNTTLKLKIPLTKTEVSSVKAALGQIGMVEGIDYRGKPVLADIRKIPELNWILLTKEDKDEIFADLKLYLIIISLFGIFLIAITGLGLVVIYTNRQKEFYRKISQKEIELWQFQEKFKVVLDSIGDGVITTDINGKIEYMNRLAEKLTGWSFRDARGRQLTDVYIIKSETTGEIEKNPVQKVLQQGYVKYLANHTILISKDGREIPIMDTGAPVYSKDGSIIGVVLAFQDETERRKQEQMLRRSEALLSQTGKIARVGGWEINMETFEVIWTEETRNIHEVDPDFVPNLDTAIEFYEPEARPIITEAVKNAIEKGEPYDLELPFITAKGRKLWIQTQGNPEFRDGKCVRLYGTFMDITERKQMIEKIKANERFLTNLFDVIFDVILIFNIEEQKIISVNKAVTNVFGYKPEELIGSPLSILLYSKEFYEKFNNMLNNALQKAEPIKNEELKAIRKDGTEIWCDFGVVFLNTEDNIKIAVAVLRDVTERKKLIDSIIEAKERAEEMNRLKTYFLGNMSHELRTPFVGIKGFAELLNDSLNDPVQKEWVEAIIQSSNRILDTISKLLDITQLEFGKTRKELKKINIAKVLENSFNSFVGIAKQKKLVLKKELFPNKKLDDNSLTYFIDERLLNEIIENLLSNAIKFTFDGSVTLFADIEIKNRIEHLVIKVIDTGIGIPKEKQNLIWEEFRQVSEGLNRNFEGVGLGLSITKRFVELLNGTITVESEVGKGSTFIVEIPLLKSIETDEEIEQEEGNELEQPQNLVEQPINVKNKSILYVEDDIIAQNLAREVLSKYFYIDFASGSTEALELIHKNKYNVIIIDINLGYGIDGVQLLKMIKTFPDYEEIPKIALTAYASDADKEEFLSLGFNYYLAKPYSPKDLLKLVLDILQ